MKENVFKNRCSGCRCCVTKQDLSGFMARDLKHKTIQFQTSYTFVYNSWASSLPTTHHSDIHIQNYTPLVVFWALDLSENYSINLYRPLGHKSNFDLSLVWTTPQRVWEKDMIMLHSRLGSLSMKAPLLTRLLCGIQISGSAPSPNDSVGMKPTGIGLQLQLLCEPWGRGWLLRLQQLQEAQSDITNP